MQDSTHKRWEKKSTPSSVLTWNYYNDVIAPQIIREALKQPLTLKELYLALVSARAKCEWVKEQNPTAPEEVEYYAYQEMDSFPGEFSNRPNSGTAEAGIYEEDIWGPEIVRLVSCRLGDKPLSITSGAVSTRIALHLYACGWGKTPDSLQHPVAEFRDKANGDFQALLNSNNLFDYFKHAARLMHALSNFPPTARGSAAVNTWIIQKIFIEKFGLNIDIRPHLYDWTAYFETTEHYVNFFMISATVKYLKSIPEIYDKNKAFYDSIPELLLQDPNDPNVTDRRQSIWSEIQSHVADAIEEHSSSLAPAQINNLNAIYAGKILFRKPSPVIETYLLDRVITDQNKAYLVQLLRLNKTIVEQYLELYGNPRTEEDFHQRWVDLERLRKVFNSKELDELEQKITSDIPILSSASNSVTPAGKAAAREAPSKWEAALISGGIREEDLTAFPTEQRDALTSPASILLYNANKFIRAKDVVGQNVRETQLNILKLITKHFCGEDEEIVAHLKDPDVIQKLLSLVSYFSTKKIKMSEIMGDTVNDVSRNMIKAVLIHIYEEPEARNLIENASDKEILQYDSELDLVSFNPKNKIFDVCAARKILAEHNLKAHALMQLPHRVVQKLVGRRGDITQIEEAMAEHNKFVILPSAELRSARGRK